MSRKTNRRFFAIWSTGVALTLAMFADAYVAADSSVLTADDGVIVVWKEGAKDKKKEQALAAVAETGVHHFRLVRASVVRLPSHAAQIALADNPLVESVVPNRRLYPDGKIMCDPDSGCGGGSGSSQSIPSGVTRIGAAPGALQFTGAGVGVAVLDTGIDRFHPDLVNRVGANCKAIFDCDVDPDGHGTAVAGVVAANDNDIGIVGVAPGAVVYNVQICSPGCNDGLLMAGLEWVVENWGFNYPPIQVVNISFGRDRDPNLDDTGVHLAVQAVYALGIPIVVSAGNNPLQTTRDRMPAYFNETIAVASTSARKGIRDQSPECASFLPVLRDTASWFTTDGAFGSGGGVTISAPGAMRDDLVGSGGVCTLTSRGLTTLAAGGGYVGAAGTSLSAPHVAGVVALMQEQAFLMGISLSPFEIQDKLRSSAIRVGVAPLDSVSSDYTFDGEREGILWAPGALD